VQVVHTWVSMQQHVHPQHAGLLIQALQPLVPASIMPTCMHHSYMRPNCTSATGRMSRPLGGTSCFISVLGHCASNAWLVQQVLDKLLWGSRIIQYYRRHYECRF
jgi:hypothetical protein